VAALLRPLAQFTQSVPDPWAWQSQWRRRLTIPGVLIGTAIGAGVLAGVLAGRTGVVLPLALIIGGVGAGVILRDARVGLFTALAVICLLPYATLPIKIGLTFTLLELTTLLTFAVLALRMAYDRSETIVPSPVYLPLGLFVLETAVAFLLGAGRNTTTQTAHDYAKLMLGVGCFALVVQLIHTRREVAALATTLIAGGGVAAATGIALNRLPVGLTANLLVRLRVVGYPTDRLVRYIEDDPALARRATGTAVDPNSFAGFLMVVLVLAIGQAVAKRPLVPRPLAVCVAPLAAVALLMTQSRAAALGAAGGVLILVLARYRWLLPVCLAGVAGALFLGRGGGFGARLLAGFRGEDAATRLRFREFGNALTLIRDYPLFGVGFGDAPRIDLQTGVSSVYLTVAERAGLLGFGLFAVLLAVLLGRLIIGGIRAPTDAAAGELLLAIGATLAAACLAAVLDHYFFNLGFPHMAALFWLIAGLGEVLRGVVKGESEVA